MCQPVIVDSSEVIRGTMIDGNAKGQIEVAVIERPIPIDTDLMATHQMRERRRIKRIFQGSHVSFHRPVPFELFSISPYGHIGHNDQPVKVYIPSSFQLLAIDSFQLHLRRGKDETAGIEGEMQQ